MRFAHISDLHIGKRVNEFSMLEEQRHILSRIVQIIQEKSVDAVLIAGDIYDKTVPSAEAVALCDGFITQLAALKKPVFIISGNHDCAERIAFGSRIMAAADIYIAPVFDGTVQKVSLQDTYGDIHIYLLPFIKPVYVRRFYEKHTIDNYTDAVQTVLEHTEINCSERNVLLAHQFVTGASRCESEEITVGGLDNVDACVFEPFDYVALGHIHSPQRVGTDQIRYCGSPLKYSFSEAGQQKSITLVDIGEKADGQPADMQIEMIPLKPVHDLRKLRGSYEELTYRENYLNTDTQDYLHVTLTDEEDIPDAIGKLRSIYPNIMKLDYDNVRTRTKQDFAQTLEVAVKSPAELFEDFYAVQNNQPMNEEQRAFVTALIDEIWHS